MPKIYVTDWSGDTHEIEGRPGATLMETIRKAGIDDLAAICGGCCSCATCHVYVDEAWLGKLPDREDDEYELLSDSVHYQEQSRLSCQIPLSDALDGLKVTVAPEE
ncbi:ferredoxin [Iodidimonas nitroreducens]|uniref:Ferredoxin n=1 Tax=Iodidimonas nitroreducens TaxID=1236968 RepID=A0A5A7N9K2_9PROT|nr:2Fe-2S iron-sulfur cluster-binding protein [Iodidimonas nitroreducens]GAK33371.1 2Fe-2S ferredoxin [alpha proteobacterium Q-1]GER04607.1 ferredoxin [Iodidimonas nitroreducens]